MMEFPEEKEIENGYLPIRRGDFYDNENIYVVNVKKLLSMIDDLEERIEYLEKREKRIIEL